MALGYDEGDTLIKLGREEPPCPWNAGGMIICAKHSELQQASLKALEKEEIQDGERLHLAGKDMGSCKVYLQTVQHNTNGKFVVVSLPGQQTARSMPLGRAVAAVSTCSRKRDLSQSLVPEYFWLSFAGSEVKQRTRVAHFLEKKEFKKKVLQLAQVLKRNLYFVQQ